jgi:hypothetical protein
MKNKVTHVLSALTFAIFIFIAFGTDDENSNSSSGSGGTGTDTETEQKQNSEPDVEILQHSSEYNSTMNSYTVHCRVRNNTNDLISYLDIKATFYDEQGKIVGTGTGNAANLAAGAEKTIDVMAMGVDNADRYEVQINNVMYQ